MALLTQSYVHGVSSTPLIGETIGQLLRRVTAEGPERPALVAAGGGLAITVGLGMIGAWRTLSQKPAAYLREL